MTLRHLYRPGEWTYRERTLTSLATTYLIHITTEEALSGLCCECFGPALTFWTLLNFEPLSDIYCVLASLISVLMSCLVCYMQECGVLCAGGVLMSPSSCAQHADEDQWSNGGTDEKYAV